MIWYICSPYNMDSNSLTYHSLLMANSLKRISIQITYGQYQSLKDRSSPGKSISSLIRSALEKEEYLNRSNKDLFNPIFDHSNGLITNQKLQSEFN